jgi:hypothetical protein
MGQRAPGFGIKRRGYMKKPTKAVLYRALELATIGASHTKLLRQADADAFIRLAEQELERSKQ